MPSLYTEVQELASPSHLSSLTRITCNPPVRVLKLVSRSPASRRLLIHGRAARSGVHLAVELAVSSVFALRSCIFCRCIFRAYVVLLHAVLFSVVLLHVWFCACTDWREQENAPASGRDAKPALIVEPFDLSLVRGFGGDPPPLSSRSPLRVRRPAKVTAP